jgi:hypothetical protein
MAKNTINILCPSGHRRKAQMTPNTNLLQVRKSLYRLFIFITNYMRETVYKRIIGYLLLVEYHMIIDT